MESGSSKARPLRQNPSRTGAPEEITVSIPPADPRSYYHKSDREEDRAFRPALPSLRRRTDEADSSRGRRRRSGLGSHRTEETGEERGGAGVGFCGGDLNAWIYSPSSCKIAEGDITGVPLRNADGAKGTSNPHTFGAKSFISIFHFFYYPSCLFFLQHPLVFFWSGYTEQEGKRSRAPSRVPKLTPNLDIFFIRLKTNVVQ